MGSSKNRKHSIKFQALLISKQGNERNANRKKECVMIVKWDKEKIAHLLKQVVSCIIFKRLTNYCQLLLLV